MLTDIARRIARWHPIVLTLAFVAGAFLEVASLGLTPPPLARGVLMLTSIGPLCVWLWAIFHVSRQASSAATSSYSEWVFALPPAVAFAAGVAEWSTHNSPAALAIFLGLFVALSQAAKRLENADAPDGNASVGRMLTTALLMFLAPFGVWVLYPKVLRVAARPRETLATA